MKTKKPPRARPVSTPKRILDAARDFRLGSSMLEKHYGSPLFPLRCTVVTQLFAIELYLKYLAAHTSGLAPEGHNLLDLYNDLPRSVQDAVLRHYEGSRSIRDVLAENKLAFIDWRYIYEKQDGEFSLDFKALGIVAAALEAVATQP